MGGYKSGVSRGPKGYPRARAGPLRDQLIHRVVAAAFLRRELKKGEEVHHRDGNRLNFHFSNLIVMGTSDHGWVSAKQAWFMRRKDEKEKAEWDAFMEDEAKRFQNEVEEARLLEAEWTSRDGEVREAWDKRGRMD